MKISVTTILIIGVFFFFTACSKKSQTSHSNTGNIPGLTGSWKWSMSTTGWGGTYAPGSDTTIVLSFYNDATYSLMLNGQLKYTGHFSTAFTPEPNSITIISFTENLNAGNLKLLKKQNVLAVDNDLLYLCDSGIADGSRHLFAYKK